MSGSGARRGGGFLTGALTGLAVSALALTAWSLSAPLTPRSAWPAPEAAAPSTDDLAPAATVARAVPETAAPAAQTTAPEVASATAPAPQAAPPDVAPEAASKPETAPAPVLVAESVADPVADPVARSTAAPGPERSADAAPEPAATVAARALESSAPSASQPAPPEPAWRRNAEAFDARGAAPVAVALTGIDAANLARALALGAPLTLAIYAAAPDASALVARARAAGCEVVTLGAAADPRAVGVAAPGFDTDALTRARAEGLLTLALTPGGGASPSNGAAAMFRLESDASAARVFQTLQEAARRAAPGGGVVVALAASDAALTGLARWLAVTDAAPAPLSAVAVSAGR